AMSLSRRARVFAALMAFVIPLAATTIGSSDAAAKARATDAAAKPAATDTGTKPRATNASTKPRAAKKRVRPAVHGAGYRPPYTDIMIDDNSGQVLHETDPDAPRHPASLTKVMTLYLLFGELEAGRIKLDYDLAVSERASSQNPTKHGLRAGQTIKVED